jgi:hypothetical protein
MKLTFLEAKEPLTKSYGLDDQGNLTKSSYPIVKNFKSHTLDISKIEDLYTHMQAHAVKNHSLLKGNLNRPLEWESRAGSTDAHSETEWICFDLDLDLGFATPQAFMTYLAARYPQYYDVSYIVQYSASYMVHQPTPLKCHIMMLCDPIAAPMLKLHIQDINLKLFSEKLKLTKTNNALSWGIDITACQNDKLLYIAPPVLDKGVKNLFNQARIQLVPGAKDIVSLSTVTIPTAESLKTQTNNIINTLREQSGLAKRKKFDMKFLGSQSYLPTSESASITGMRVDRGFVYFNLNGGDSWAYFHPEGKPDFINNFKGEPTYLTKELLPDYWSDCKSQQNSQQSLHTATTAARASGQKVFLAFRNFKESRYVNGWYDPIENAVTLRYCTKDQLADFLKSHGQPVPDFFSDWEVIYDPTVQIHPYMPLDTVNRTINTFIPSKYMLMKPSALQKKIVACPPTIQKVLNSLMDGDQALIDHWHNHLAFILRERKKTRTAWVFQGIEGTGKGLLFYEILRPLLGESNTTIRRFEELEEKYTDCFEQALFAVIDEADMSENPKKGIIMANLKNQITEPTLTVRRMFSTAYETPNFTNYSFNSNMKREPVIVSTTDRRFNIAPFQTKPLHITDKEIKQITRELDDYALFLHNLQINQTAVSKPMLTAARSIAIENSRSSIDMIADIITSGDIQALWDSLPHDPNTLDIQMSMRYQAYKALMDDIIRTRRTKLHRDELLTIFQFNVGNIPTSPAKFTRFCGHHNLDIGPVNINGNTVRGVRIENWEAPESWWAERLQEVGEIKLSLVKKEA